MKAIELSSILLVFFLVACAGGQTAVRIGPVGMVLPDKSEQLEDPPEPADPKTYSILRQGSFHGEDVPKIEPAGWVGLYVENGKAYTDSVAISSEAVHDKMLDDEGEKSGIKISAEPGGARFLINGIQAGECPFIGQDIGSIFPGEIHEFDYFGRRFELKATAATIGEEGDFNALRNYQLVLSIEMNGREEAQVLAASYQFDDAQMDILFIGDLDGDGWPDLILNTSPKYSYREISLYLSSPAGGKDLVRHVATFKATSC